MMSQMMDSPKLVTPPPPNIQAKQPRRFTARVALLTPLYNPPFKKDKRRHGRMSTSLQEEEKEEEEEEEEEEVEEEE
ncbi:hypothetical protein EYF80_048525 [Liparis tanakae]|uniref:Uncharacterized protein n=1 Tax=Liparis tanakae TaxID=230148 RepID=A0A4Z2FJZ9_9TELE|nr:hypothetical protein EYF80_048525 [Liparis tanakae]